MFAATAWNSDGTSNAEINCVRLPDGQSSFDPQSQVLVTVKEARDLHLQFGHG